jgi:hypothetical protein
VKSRMDEGTIDKRLQLGNLALNPNSRLVRGPSAQEMGPALFMGLVGHARTCALRSLAVAGK